VTYKNKHWLSLLVLVAALVVAIIAFSKVYSEAVTLSAFILLVLSVSVGVTAGCFERYYAVKQKSRPDQQKIAVETLNKISRQNIK
jgi:fatty-acid desaturase